MHEGSLGPMKTPEEWEILGKVTRPIDADPFFWECTGYTIEAIRSMIAEGTYPRKG